MSDKEKLNEIKAKFLEVAYLTKIEKANPNASGTEMNITTLKKTEEIDGTQRVYISGASIKYGIKEYWRTKPLQLSPILPRATQRQITTKCDWRSYIDDDLFGYMDTQTGRKRIAPVKTNGMISLFKYTGDINRGVRFDPTPAQQHSMYDIEITTNVMRSNFVIEIDRIGSDFEIVNNEPQKQEIKPEEKDSRIKHLFDALFNLWCGGHQTNFLTMLSPQVMIVVIRDDKVLTIADKLKIDEQYNLDIETLKEALKFHKSRVKNVWIGYFSSFIQNGAKLENLANDPELKKNDGKQWIEVMKMDELRDKILNQTKFLVG